VPTRPAQARRPPLAASQRPTPVPGCCFHPPGLGITERRQGFTGVHPSGLPVACSPGWNGSPWASAPGFTPRRYQRRMPKWGRALGHLPGITSPASTGPPQRIHSPRGPSCRTPACPSSPIAAVARRLAPPGVLAPDQCRSLLGYLAKIADPRHRRGRRHPLVGVLGVAVCAVLAGQHACQWVPSSPPLTRPAILASRSSRPGPSRRASRQAWPREVQRRGWGVLRAACREHRTSLPMNIDGAMDADQYRAA
jgi:DDE_Tnp_1-associated